MKKYNKFSMVLMLTHDCNLRCRYCYSGSKYPGSMDIAVARKAIDRAIASTAASGTLEIAFFGGEPLLEVDLIEEIIKYARNAAIKQNIKLAFSLTTNGTLLNSHQKHLIENYPVTVSVSCDGIEEVHDMNRYDIEGKGSSEEVYRTIRYLISLKKEFTVVAVISPDNVRFMTKNIRFFRDMGVRYIEFNLNLWSEWSRSDISALEDAVAESVPLWYESLPDIGINWFDEKMLLLTGNYIHEKCGFGNGEIAVAPSGSLYPCERLIGEEKSEMRIEDDIFTADDFLTDYAPERRVCSSCASCSAVSMCGSDCRCSNYIRSGDIDTPDNLLCSLEKRCFCEVSGIIKKGGKKCQITKVQAR